MNGLYRWVVPNEALWSRSDRRRVLIEEMIAIAFYADWLVERIRANNEQVQRLLACIRVIR